MARNHLPLDAAWLPVKLGPGRPARSLPAHPAAHVEAAAIVLGRTP